MSSNPYANAPDYRRWREAISQTAPHDVDPLISAPFQITRSDKIVSAGSCFAQHIARRLVRNGFNYLVTETAHPLLPDDVTAAFGYGLYSARYGNIYTPRQLLQLLRRAYRGFVPRDDVWEEGGRYRDPYRPAIQANGFATREEFEIDRRQHFAAVRQAFEAMDIFIFTLGLTECWISVEDGAVYPICPGTIAGHFDPTRHQFANLAISDLVADMKNFILEVRDLNPKVRILLTVSPVPLAATAEDRHVLVSTVYSKSALRVAAQELTKLPNVAYFPAYEIVTGSYSRGRYFADDHRAVTEEGVDHVMRIFFRHVAPDGDGLATASATSDADCSLKRATEVIAGLCEEEHLNASK